jgi:hypothetical protein
LLPIVAALAFALVLAHQLILSSLLALPVAGITMGGGDNGYRIPLAPLLQQHAGPDWDYVGPLCESAQHPATHPAAARARA